MTQRWTTWPVVTKNGVAVAAPTPIARIALGRVRDPRKSRGVRHRFTSVVAVGVCAVLAGARSFAAIAEWAHDLNPVVRATLGIGRVPPSESTIRRMLQRVDPDELDQAVCTWLLTQQPRPGGTPVTVPGRKVFALDGKTARGARTGDGRAVHLFAALDHDTGTVLGQTAVDAKTNEVNMFGPLLDRIDITGAVNAALADSDVSRLFSTDQVGLFVDYTGRQRITRHRQPERRTATSTSSSRTTLNSWPPAGTVRVIHDGRLIL